MALRQDDLRMDFLNLISCIECHEEEKNVNVIIETFKTIVSICSEEDCGKDAFRDVGGLDFLLDFIANTDQVAILEYGLKALAFIVDENVHNQLHLTKLKIFKILQVIFEKGTFPLAIVKNAVVLFPTILFQNRTAQELIREEDYLSCLINLYKQYVPRSTIYCKSSAEDPECLEIWLNINSALCFAVNNPLNEKNQVVCSCLFPISLSTIESSNTVIIDASSSFLSLSIANNGKNQDAFAEYDGFLILKHCLNKYYDLMLSDIKECNNVISKGTVQVISCLIGIISAAAVDNGKNAAICGQLGIVSQMIQFLSTDVLNSSVKKKAILVLGHCIDAFCDNKSFILDVPQFDVLLKKNLETDDNELCYAAKYLLQVCLKESRDELKTTSSSGTPVSSHRSILVPFHKRCEDNIRQQTKSRADATSKWHEHGNFHHNAPYDGNKCTNSLVEFQNDPLSLQEKIDLLNSISDEELKYHKIKKSEKIDLNTSNLFNHSDLGANIMPHEKRQEKKQHMERYTKTCLGADDKNSKCNSLDEISLKSAGHLYRLNKMRLQKANIKAMHFNDKFNTIDKKCAILPNKKRKNCNLDASKLSKFSEIKNAKLPYNGSKLNISKAYQCMNCSNCSCLSKRNKTFSGNNTANCSNKSSFKPKSTFSSKQKNFSSDLQLDCLALRRHLCVNNIHSWEENAKHKFSKNSDSNCANMMSHRVCHNEPLNAHSVWNSSDVTKCKKKIESIDNQPAARTEASSIRSQSSKQNISKLLSINLQPFSKSCSVDEANRKPKSHLNRARNMSQKENKMPGCVEVIALPGPSCTQHKVISHFEMLKVCPLQNVSNTA